VKTIAINVEKGGAGKTTIACHLAWILADAGHRVLFLDLDRQCNATAALAEFESLGTCKPLFEPGYAPPASVPRLSIYSNRMGGEYDADYTKALGNVRANFPKLDPAFDFCVIDTPPSWSWINFAALMVTDSLIIPVELGPFGPASTKQVSDSIATVNQRARTKPIHVAGLVANRVKANDRAQMEMLAAIRAKVGKNLFTSYLPDRSHYSQALQEHVPVWRLNKDVRGSLPAMRAFLEEAMTRIGSQA
jgi:chromosome partitioning protein